MKIHESFKKVQESSWKFLKAQESSRKLMILKFHDCSLFNKFKTLMKRTIAWTAIAFSRELMVSLFTLPPLLFWKLQHIQFWPHQLFLRDDLLRARNPNAFALPRIAEPSHRPAFIVYHTSSSCNFAFMQRVHVQICLSGFCGHDFMERSVVTLETPSVKRKSPRKNSPPQQRIVETRTIEISWFY